MYCPIYVARAASKTLDQLLKKLKDHLEPVSYEMAESFKFNSIKV